MTPKELKLASEFLKQFSERLGSDGCNDWEFPDDWTNAEITQFKRDICEWNRGGETVSDWENVPNWVAVGVLASKLGLTPSPVNEQ